MPTIVAFTKDWDDVPTCTTHVLREMAKSLPVLWVESIGTRRPRISGGRDLARILRRLKRAFAGAERKEESLWVLSPFLIPKATAQWQVLLNRLLFKVQQRYTLRQMTASSVSPWPLATCHLPLEYWCFVPSAVDLLSGFRFQVSGFRREAKLRRPEVVYYCTDDWTKFENLDGEWLGRKERELLARADVVFAASRYLASKCGRISGSIPRKTENREPRTENLLHYLPHGVAYAKFAAALTENMEIPADVADLPRPVVGFYGNLYPWIDFALLAELARRRPGWSFVLIGQRYCDLSLLDGLANVHLLGRREHDELPGYCKAFDAALIPYIVAHPRMQSVNPVKTKELLAAGVPIVASDVPELRGYGEDVRICRTVEEWLAALERQVAGKDRREISERMRGEDWSVKVKEIRRIVDAAGTAAAARARV